MSEFTSTVIKRKVIHHSSFIIQHSIFDIFLIDDFRITNIEHAYPAGRDEVIRNQQMFWTKLNYIHNNPIEAGLVSNAEDYKYSSARNYIDGVEPVLEVDVDYAGVKIL